MSVLRVLISALSFFAISTAWPVRAEDTSVIDIIVDQARLIRLDTNAVQIIIGNPAVADVAIQGRRLLIVTGKSYGTTNLIALDAEDREILNAKLDVREANSRQVTVYKGAARHSYHCAPNCQRILSIGDDKAQFEQLADTVSKKFSVVNSVIGGN